MLPKKHARRVETARETRAPAIGGRIASHDEGLRRDGDTNKNTTAPKATSRITNRRVPFFHLACHYCLPTQLTKMSHER